MSRRELHKLHYTEEIKMAEMILSFEPFHKEKNCSIVDMILWKV